MRKFCRFPVLQWFVTPAGKDEVKKTPALPTTESNDSRTSESEESEVFVQNDEAITSLNIGRYS